MKKIFRKILRELRVGAAQVLVISPGRNYTVPAGNPFRSDAANLRRDAARTAHDLARNFKR